MKQDEIRNVKFDVNGMEHVDKEKIADDSAKRMGFYKEAVDKVKSPK